MIPALIAAGATIAGGLINNAGNKKESELAYKRQLQLMNYQNDYNNPVNQMKRLKQAGLNPNMVYGSGNVSGNLTGDMPKYQPIKKDYGIQQAGENFMSTLTQYQQLDLMKKQADKIDADTAAVAQDTENKKVLGDIYNTKAYWDKFKMAKDAKLTPYELDIKIQDAQKSKIEVQNAIKTGEIRESELLTKKVQRQKLYAEINAIKLSSAQEAIFLKKLAEHGEKKNDPWYVSISAKLAKRLGLTLEMFWQLYTGQNWNAKGFEIDPEYKKTLQKKSK